MQHLDKRASKQLNKLGHNLWTQAGNQCLMKGIPTSRGTPPDYCGEGAGWPILSHTISKNVIDDVNGGYNDVVAFSPRVNPSRWSANVTQGPVFPKTPLSVVTVGRYACAWHDGLFRPIDSVPYGVATDRSVPALIALRASLMEHFLASRHSEFFGKRAEYCRSKLESWPVGEQECDCRERWRDYYDSDRRNAELATKRHVPALLKECESLVDIVKASAWSEIVASTFFLPGTPSLGGTLVWIPRMGTPMTMTVVPVKNGHHIYITHRPKPGIMVQKVLVNLLSKRISDSRKARILSEIALQQNWAMFILKPRWCSMSQQERDMVCEIAREMGWSLPSGGSLRESLKQWKQRWRRGRVWALKDDHRVPDLFLGSI